MASENKPTTDAVEESFRNLKLDTAFKDKNEDIVAGRRDGSTSEATSCISSADATSIVRKSQAGRVSLVPEQGVYSLANGLYGYYYPGFDGLVGEWDNQSFFMPTDGLQIQQPANTVLPMNKLHLYPNQGKNGFFYSNNPSSIKETGRGWVGVEKQKARNRAHGAVDFDMLNEQNRGPRTNVAKDTIVSGPDPVGSVGAEGTNNCITSVTVMKKDEYNLPDFPTKYDNAFFFVIKSYSEDNIHKSIKYNVWASTPNGNKRLEAAFQAAQEKMAEKRSKCPVFLFFSVNASGNSVV